MRRFLYIVLLIALPAWGQLYIGSDGKMHVRNADSSDVADLADIASDGSASFKDWILGQISAPVDFSPLGSWPDWVVNQTQNGFWIMVQHWTDSSYWYLAPDTTAMWLSDTMFAGSDTVLYVDFENSVRDARGHLEIYVADFAATDTVTVAHGLGTRQVAIQIWQNDSTETWPNEAAWVDDNTLQVVFLSELSGKVLTMALRQ
jgi:hypothetical protein